MKNYLKTFPIIFIGILFLSFILKVELSFGAMLILSSIINAYVFPFPAELNQYIELKTRELLR